MHNRKGDWIQTYQGKRFWPLDPRAEEIDIIDIAHSLAMKCRYGGHCSRFYSVAEHSILVSRALPYEYALWGLMHDAAEAYLADICKPVKPYLAGWKEIESGVMRAVCERFGLEVDEPEIVKKYDHRILTDEKRYLMKEGPSWGGLIEGLGVEIEFLSPEKAKDEFLTAYFELMYQRKLRG